MLRIRLGWDWQYDEDHEEGARRGTEQLSDLEGSGSGSMDISLDSSGIGAGEIAENVNLAPRDTFAASENMSSTATFQDSQASVDTTSTCQPSKTLNMKQSNLVSIAGEPIGEDSTIGWTKRSEATGTEATAVLPFSDYGGNVNSKGRHDRTQNRGGQDQPAWNEDGRLSPYAESLEM